MKDMDLNTSYQLKQSPATYSERFQNVALAGALALFAQIASAQLLPTETLHDAKFTTNSSLASVSEGWEGDVYVQKGIDDAIGDLAISLAGRQTGLNPEIAKVLTDHLSELFD